MTERHIDQKTSLLFEVYAQLDSFNLESFRRLYHESDLSKYRYYHCRSIVDPFLLKKGQVTLDQCIDEGVDDFSYIPRYTEGTAELTIVFFGRPDDCLIDEHGDLTETAQHVISRVASYRENFREQWMSGAPPPLTGGFKLIKLDLQLFIGRRTLGAEVFGAFRDILKSYASLRGILVMSNISHPPGFPRPDCRDHQESIDSDKLIEGNLIQIRSFD